MQRGKVGMTSQRPQLGNPLSKGYRAKWKLSTLLAIFAVIAIAVIVDIFVLLSRGSVGQLLAISDSPDTVKTASSALRDKPGESEDKSSRKVEQLLSDEQPSSRGATEYHIIFSSGCKVSQDWQSYVFFYHAMVNKQPGTVTRIVSGCTEKQEAALKNIFQEQIHPMAPGRFKIHFTPDYSRIIPGGRDYKYFNKPFGTKHWMENVLGFPDNPENEDAIVILLDPDQAIVRPFTNNDFSNTDWKFLDKGQVPRTRVEHGKPMGQQYGFGVQWKLKIDMALVVPNEKSPVDELTNKDARAFMVGPPYAATARDMYKIASKWCEFAIPVHDQYPKLLAEMFAYCLAAAHLRLPHQVASSFMVSDVGAGLGEGWKYVDKMDASEVCRKHKPEDLPNVIHFCQRYGLGHWFFGKYRLPDSFLTCESPLMAEPPDDIATRYTTAYFPGGQIKNNSPQYAKRNAFMLCQMIPALNNAAAYFKHNHCDGKGNFSKTFGYSKLIGKQ